MGWKAVWTSGVSADFGFCLPAGADVECSGHFGLFDSVSLGVCVAAGQRLQSSLFFFVLQVFMGFLNKPGFSVSVPTIVALDF